MSGQGSWSRVDQELANAAGQDSWPRHAPRQLLRVGLWKATTYAKRTRPDPSRLNAGAALDTDDVSTADAFLLGSSTGFGHTDHGPLTLGAYATPMRLVPEGLTTDMPVKKIR
jgi:hypothetical protein